MEKFGYLNANVDYIDSLYQDYLKSPDSVSLEWKRFFEGMEFSKGGAGASLSEKDLNVYRLIRAFRDYGHFEARLNPLQNSQAKSEELSLQRFGLVDADLNQNFSIGAYKGSLKDILEKLRRTYCGTLSVQVADAKPRIRDWFINEFENEQNKISFSKEEKIQILNALVRTESFEKFLHTRYVGAKRFSIEGADATIPMLDRIVNRGTAIGTKEVVIGMAHRGRLNVLANFMGKGYGDIFSEFDGKAFEGLGDLDGDVKYHLGYQSEKPTVNGPCGVELAFNPSHLEAVNPVVLGMTRAKQRARKDTEKRKTVVPFLIHGDAAMAGQGVVSETFQMSQLKGYTVGGTIHLVIDNQVGFTADPEDTRSSPYASDVAKSQLTPVLHVNGDDVEACVRAADIAIRFRQEFGHDIVINMICYRRYGHNEGDEPAFTQPLMYGIIKNHPTVSEVYGQKLIGEKILDQAALNNLFQEKMDSLQKILDEVRKNPTHLKFTEFKGLWKGLRRSKPEDFEKDPNTKADLKTLKKVGEILTTFPKGFTPHPKIEKLVEQRRQMSTGEKPIDWGMAELMAYGSLIEEGTSVRLSGQDCGRGTFTHRHSNFYDIKNGEVYTPLKHVNPNKEFCVYDSLLSEMGVLGFEYGNSISDPTFLTIWEAQFGDFVNGAQIIIDQFITAGESKWFQMTGLVMLLPHGYEGQGPEHSSARLERFMQACAQYNIQVANFTTPAQLFHGLRRQTMRDFRKPLIVMSPKSLLRHAKVVSTLEDLSQGGFEEILLDPAVQDLKSVENFVFCSGRVYYDADEAREKGGLKSDKTALIRVEQLYPFPEKKILAALKSAKKIKRMVWMQEEPKNMGAYGVVAPWFADLAKQIGAGVEVEYIGRDPRASPATGSPYKHQKEQKEIIDNFLSIYKG